MRTVCFLGVVLVLLSGVALADRATLDDTATQVAMPLSTPPTIDGIIEGPEWQEAAGATPGGTDSYWRITFNDLAEDFVRGGINSITNTDGPLGPEDFGIRIWVGYDSDNLYVAVRVTDDLLFADNAEAGSQNGETWRDDSVEVFIDGDNSNFPTRDVSGTNPEIVDSGGQYVITYNNAYREAEAGNPGYGPDAAWYALTAPTATGYDAEFRISLSDLGNPQPGDIIGFTIAVNDDDSGDLDNQYMWIGATHEEITYGNLILGPLTYVAPKVTAAPTVDGVVNADEYSGAEQISVDTFTGVYSATDGDIEWEVGDHGFNAWVVHDTDAIYIGLDVTDDDIVTNTAEAGTEDGSTWLDDSIELFIDADYSRLSGRDSAFQFEGQFVLTPNGAWRDNEANNPLFGEDLDWFAATTTTDTGYQMEFKILKATLLDPEDGATLGFNLSQNDDDDPNDGIDRKAQFSWMGIPHNEISYGNLVLSPTGGTPVAEWSLY